MKTDDPNIHSINHAFTLAQEHEAQHKQAIETYYAERHRLLEQMGAALQAMRKTAGLSAKTMADMTRISRGCLNAAEAPATIGRYLRPETVVEYAEHYQRVIAALPPPEPPKPKKPVGRPRTKA